MTTSEIKLKLQIAYFDDELYESYKNKLFGSNDDCNERLKQLSAHDHLQLVSRVISEEGALV